jgi:hypothetical protein
MYNQAMEDEAAHRNPAARIGKLNKRSKDEPRKKIDPLTREEIQVLLKAASEKSISTGIPYSWVLRVPVSGKVSW